MKRFYNWVQKIAKGNFFKVLLVYLSFLLYVQLFTFIFKKLPLDLLQLQELVMDDVDLTDIYYRTDFKTKANTDSNIVFINTGSLDDNLLRHHLVQILDTLAQTKYKPRAIALDFLFKNENKEKEIIHFLGDKILTGNVIIGISTAPESSKEKIIFDSAKYKTLQGYINFPVKQNNSIRTYYKYFVTKHNDTLVSMAQRLHKILMPNSNDYNVTSFNLRYSSADYGIYNVLDTSFSKDKNKYYKAIEASALLEDTSIKKSFLQDFFKNKVVIIAYIGPIIMDTNSCKKDVHRVPVNKALFNRIPSMPGPVVHANALQMLNEYEKNYSNLAIKIINFLEKYIPHLLVFGYLWMFFLIHKIKLFWVKELIEILFLLSSFVLFVFFASYLMNFHFHLNLNNIFLQVALLVQFKIFAFGFYEFLENRKSKSTQEPINS